MHRNREVGFGAFAEREDLRNEVVGLREPAGRECPGRPCGLDLPEVRGLLELLCDALHCSQAVLEPADVAQHQLDDEPVQVAVHETLGVSDAFGHLEELRRYERALCERVGGDDRRNTAVQRVSQSCRVSGAARQLDRLAA